MTKFKIRVWKKSGKVEVSEPGVSTGKLTVKGWTDKGIIVHTAGHSYSYGNMPGDRSYAPAETDAYVIDGSESQDYGDFTDHKVECRWIVGVEKELKTPKAKGEE